MTRINLVPPKDLSDQHLLAEIRELPRIFSLVEKNPSTENIPESYQLGRGHMNFFKDKLQFLKKRYRKLYHEWTQNRNGNYTHSLQSTISEFDKIIEKYIVLNGDYSPSRFEIEKSEKRLQEKLDNPPRTDFYTWSN